MNLDTARQLALQYIANNALPDLFEHVLTEMVIFIDDNTLRNARALELTLKHLDAATEGIWSILSADEQRAVTDAKAVLAVLDPEW